MGVELEHLDHLAERQLADRLMSIAETRSVHALGIACCSAVSELTGSPTVGLYLFDGPEPELAYSQHVAEGLLDNYKAGFWKCDPVLDCIVSRGRAVDGEAVIGPQQWRQSPSYQMLQEWGFEYNMGGPLYRGHTIVGVLFTATADRGTPYTARSRERMDMLCRAGSLALTNMLNDGGLDRLHPTIRSPERAAASARRPTSLPPRTADVAIRVCRGQTNKEIAREMGISDQTVKEHVANLCRRFGVHNRTELAACLLSTGSS